MTTQPRHLAGIAIFVAGLGVATAAALLALGVWQMPGFPELRQADVRGDWFEGGYSSHWQAWLDRGEVQRIREQAKGIGADGHNRLEYSFTHERLSALRWPGHAPLVDLLALAAVRPHAQALLRQVHLRQQLPPPALSCAGNLPFWRMQLRGNQVSVGWPRQQPEQPPQPYQGLWKYLPDGLSVPSPAATTGPGIEWLGQAKHALLERLHMRIVPGRCLDSTAGIKQHGPFTYRASVILDQTLYSGCCRSAPAMDYGEASSASRNAK